MHGDDSEFGGKGADVPAANFHGRRGLRKPPAAGTPRCAGARRSIENDDRAYRPAAAQRREALVDGVEADALRDQAAMILAAPASRAPWTAARHRSP